jgi:hypothetical protein
MYLHQHMGESTADYLERARAWDRKERADSERFSRVGASSRLEIEGGGSFVSLVALVAVVVMFFVYPWFVAVGIGVLIAGATLLWYRSRIFRVVTLVLCVLLGLFLASRINLKAHHPERIVNAQTQGSPSCSTTPDVLNPADFHRDLAVGARGPDVCELQQFLISKGFLDLPAPTGYFGDRTRIAVARWQGSANLPPSGFFRSRSRAVLQDNLRHITR